MTIWYTLIDSLHDS